MSDKQYISRYGRAFKARPASYPARKWFQTENGWASREVNAQDLATREEAALSYASRAAQRGDWW